MGNNKLKKQSKFQSYLENFYTVNLFYKPSMQNDDIFYFLELNNTIRIIFRLIYENVIIITSIIPLTSSYLATFYNDLIKNLSSQNEYTILLTTISNNIDIINSCKKNDIALLDDNRFKIVNDRLYSILKSNHSNDISKYGIYLLAVSDVVNIPEENTSNKNTSIVEVEKLSSDDITIPEGLTTNISEFYKYLMLKNYTVTDITMSDTTKLYHLSILNKISIGVRDENNVIYVTNIDTVNGSTIDAMNLISCLEKYTNNDIIIQNLTNSIVYNIVKAKRYKSLDNNGSFGIKNTFGSYKIN